MEMTELMSKKGKVILQINEKGANNLNTKWERNERTF